MSARGDPPYPRCPRGAALIAKIATLSGPARADQSWGLLPHFQERRGLGAQAGLGWPGPAAGNPCWLRGAGGGKIVDDGSAQRGRLQLNRGMNGFDFGG